MAQEANDSTMQKYKDKDGEQFVCARCGQKGVVTGTLCYARRQVILVPRFQFEPEARYIADRIRIEQDLASIDFQEAMLCEGCDKEADA